MYAGEGGPSPRIPPGACQLIFKVAQSLQKNVNVSIFKLFGFVAFPSENIPSEIEVALH